MPITHVAVIRKGTIHALPKPHRHWHVYEQCIWPLASVDELATEDILEEGFLIDGHQYIGRYHAIEYAKQAGQITMPRFQPRALFSEDLW